MKQSPQRSPSELTFLHDLEHLNDASFTIKEGAAYRIRFDFFVQREICTGLKYVQKVTRHSITGNLFSAFFCVAVLYYRIKFCSEVVLQSER